MIKFNPENKNNLTYGECLGPAMQITTQEEANQYLEDYTKFIQKWLDIEPNPKGLTAKQIALQNIGYWTGYYNEETADRILKLFNTTHPIFGNQIPF